MTTEEERALVDKQEILEVMARYCRGVDRLDFDLLRSCYHPDATDEHGPFTGSRDELISWLRPRMQRYTSTMHFIANHLVELEGDVARAETYGLVFRVGDPPDDVERNATHGTRYVDRLERRDGAWGIVHRICVTEWSLVVRADDRIPVAAGSTTGARDRSDLLYTF